MHELEHAIGKGFADSTFEAIDLGLKWEPGTSRAFHQGITNAREVVGKSMQERVNEYLEQILSRLITMTIDELEREVIMLEEEAYGKPLTVAGSDAMVVIRETVERLTKLHNLK